jgi:MoxR-vWA-beta-propeller ternary system domain bpX1
MQVQISLPDYILSPNPALWELTSNGEALLWTKTQLTAALSVQLGTVCEPIFERRKGLPSLTAVLFVVDALCNPWTHELATQRIGELLSVIKRRQNTSSINSYRALADWFVALGKLPSELRKGTSQYATFLAELMEDFPSTLLDTEGIEAAHALQWLKLSTADRQLNVLRPGFVLIQKCALAIQTLEQFSRFDVNESMVRLRRRTGLDGIPTPPKLEPLPTPNSCSRLIESLKHDEQLGPFSQMAASLASTIALPRRPSDFDQFQVSGVSDIANRGHPERLLSTELASDPDLLMARIANGQALYIRRENPRQKTALRRRVLIENGVRTWGMTRLRATALALAVAASEERRNGPRLEIITAAGSKFWNEDLTTRQGLVQQLERLEPDVHPGGALVLLQSKWKEEDADIAEPLIIVARNTDRDPEFRSAMEVLPHPFFIGRIDLEGNVELIRRTLMGDEVLHRQRIDLPEKQIVRSSRRAPDLPFLLRQDPCPLRFVADFSSKWIHLARGPVLWCMTHSRRLLVVDQPGVGGRELLTLPGNVVACYSPEPDQLDLVIARPIPQSHSFEHMLVKVSAEANIETFSLGPPDQGDTKVRFCFEDGWLVRVGQELAIFETDHGRRVATERLLGHRYLGSNFFELNHSLLTFDLKGDRLQWHNLGELKVQAKLAIKDPYKQYPLVLSTFLSQIQVQDGEDNGVLHTDGSTATNATPEVILRAPKSSALIMSVDGCSNWYKLESNILTEVPKNYALAIASLDKVAGRMITPKAVRNRLKGLRFVMDQVSIMRNSSLGLELCVEDNPRRIKLRSLPARLADVPQFDFDTEVGGTDGRFPRAWSLQRASLPNDHVAWLDSRGLLHLRAKDGTELSLVLNDDHVSGWHSEEGVFGIRYFTGQPTEISVPHRVVLWLKNFARQCSPS